MQGITGTKNNVFWFTQSLSEVVFWNPARKSDMSYMAKYAGQTVHVFPPYPELVTPIHSNH